MTIRPATIGDVDTVVAILIASKAASFPAAIDGHDRDVGFWARRWRGYIASGSRAQGARGDGFVFLAEVAGTPVGYVAYHHTTRLGTDAELQNIYLLKNAQGRGIGTALLGVVAHRLRIDGSRTMCVGFDQHSPYTRFYLKHGAVLDGPWGIWRDVVGLAEQLPRPTDSLLHPPAPPTRRSSLLGRLFG